MNSKTLTIFLGVVCVALGIGLYVRNEKAVKDSQDFAAQVLILSNQVVQARMELTTQKQENSELQTNLVLRSDELRSATNNISVLKESLVKTTEESKAAAAAAKAEIERRDAKISELETQKNDLNGKIATLGGSITNLNTQIQDTERKLATSEGDRAFLLKKLKDLQDEKAQLEKQVNNLVFLREKVKKLQEELSISKRLEWIRKGLYNSSKGGEKMQQAGAPAKAPAGTNYNLNVELKQDGTVKSAPAPAAPAPPAGK